MSDIKTWPLSFLRAWSALRELLPPGLELDLVDLEHASEALRARILGEKTMSEEPLRALKELAEDEPPPSPIVGGGCPTTSEDAEN